MSVTIPRRGRLAWGQQPADAEVGSALHASGSISKISMNSFATIRLIRRGGTAAKPGRPDTSRGLALVPGAPAGLEAGTKAGIEPPVVGGGGLALPWAIALARSSPPVPCPLRPASRRKRVGKSPDALSGESRQEGTGIKSEWDSVRQPAVASIRADLPRAGFQCPTTALRGLAPARCQLQVDMVCRRAWAYCPPRSGPVPRPRPKLTNWCWRWRSSRRCPRRGAGAGEGRGPGLDQPFNPDQLRGGERGLALDRGRVRCRLVGGHGTGSSVGETPGPTGKRNRSEKKNRYTRSHILRLSWPRSHHEAARVPICAHAPFSGRYATVCY